MALPDAPQTRSEQYLNAIATGSTSGIPEAPQTRMEQYLDVIANNGGGSSGGGILTVTGTYGETAYFGVPGYALDKTYAEIHAALEAKTPVFVWQNESDEGGSGMVCLLATESYYDNENEAYIIDAGNPGMGGSRKRIQYVALSESDYPVGAYETD